MFYLVTDLVINVATFTVLARGNADPRVAWAIVALVAALNVVGFMAFMKVEEMRWMNHRKDGK